MKRRDSLKMLLASTGALLSLPSWASNWTVEDVALHPSTFSADHQALISAVADTIIPAGNSLGAVTVGVDKFLQKLFDDCYTPELQNQIKSILDNIEASAQSQFGKSFPLCEQKQREELLLKLSSGSDTEKDVFGIFKNETVRGFSTSKEVLTNYYKYKSVPGHYYGCVDVNS